MNHPQSVLTNVLHPSVELTRHIGFPGIYKPLDVALRLNYIGEYLHFLKRSGGPEYIYLGYLYLNFGFDINELVKWMGYNKQQKKSDRLKNNAKKEEMLALPSSRWYSLKLLNYLS